MQEKADGCHLQQAIRVAGSVEIIHQVVKKVLLLAIRARNRYLKQQINTD